MSRPLAGRLMSGRLMGGRLGTRPHLRRALLLAGVLPTLFVLLFGLKVALMLHANDEGRRAFDRGDYDGSEAAFSDTRSFNLLQPWVAPFDEGTALHAQGRYDAAIRDYLRALEDVPEREECTVRINLALAYESVGDALTAQRDRDGAVEAWQAGIDTLAAGDCPRSAGRGEEQADDAKAVDERLRQKLEQQQQQQPPPGDQQPPPQEPPPAGNEQPDPRQERLERNNERGLEQRREDRELYDDEDYSRPYAW